MKSTLCLGWDVGGWHSDHNANSRDAIVILNGNAELVGMIDKNGKGGLAQRFREVSPAEEHYWSKICAGSGAEDALLSADRLVVAIDTPLGFSKEFIDLIANGNVSSIPQTSAEHPYLFRATERHLARNGSAPLSPIKDMIGSQATKGIHVRLGQTPKVLSPGVWQGQHGHQTITIIEAYPTVARKCADVMNRFSTLVAQAADRPSSTSQTFGLDVNDLTDAAMCAIIAWMFAFTPGELAHPEEGVGEEGWIFVPNSIFGHA